MCQLGVFKEAVTTLVWVAAGLIQVVLLNLEWGSLPSPNLDSQRYKNFEVLFWEG